MRVITGTARGRKLKEPEGNAIRPTTDKVKEAIFNIIQFDIEGRKVLDLFAGTGQLGIEALSRGAASAVFVDESQAAIKIVTENLKRTCFESAKVIKGSWQSFLSKCGKFDLIFLDPPYESGYIESALVKIQQFDILSENGIIVAESKAEKSLPDLAFPFKKLKEYKYGKVKLATYSRLTDE